MKRLFSLLVLLSALPGAAPLASAQSSASLQVQFKGPYYTAPTASFYLPAGGGLPFVYVTITNTTSSTLYLTDGSLTFTPNVSTEQGDPAPDLYFYLQGVHYGAISPLSIAPNGTLTGNSPGGNGVTTTTWGLFELDAPNVQTRSISFTFNIYGGATPTSHDLLLSINQTMNPALPIITSSAATLTFPNAGGTITVPGSIRTYDGADDGNPLDRYTLPLPPGVTVVNTPSLAIEASSWFNLSTPAFQPEYDVKGQPTGAYIRNYPASHPLFALNIPPGTPAFTTQIGIYGAFGDTFESASNVISFVPATVDVSGTVQLEGAAAKTHNVTVVLRPADGSAATTYNVTAAPDGTFTLPQVPTKSYTLWIKGDKWLAASMPLDLSQGVVPAINLTLPGGDANNDNSVDSTDFGLLIGAFDTSASVPGDGYDPIVDFNEDGSVDSSDFGILIGNFNQTGAP